MTRDSRNNAARILFSPDLRGGEGGIRTPDTLSGMPVFKTGAINHSATSPTWASLHYPLFEAELAGMEFNDLVEVREEIRDAVVAGIGMILMLHTFLLQFL